MKYLGSISDNKDFVTKEYVLPSSSKVTSISSLSTDAEIPSAKAVYTAIPTAVSELSNDSGFLTLATLPIYDGTVV